MNKILEPHGVSVVRIITPNPQFDDRYETAIEQRKEADQEVEELRAKLAADPRLGDLLRATGSHPLLSLKGIR